MSLNFILCIFFNKSHNMNDNHKDESNRIITINNNNTTLCTTWNKSLFIRPSEFPKKKKGREKYKKIRESRKRKQVKCSWIIQRNENSLSLFGLPLKKSRNYNNIDVFVVLFCFLLLFTLLYAVIFVGVKSSWMF